VSCISCDSPFQGFLVRWYASRHTVNNRRVNSPARAAHLIHSATSPTVTILAESQVTATTDHSSLPYAEAMVVVDSWQSSSAAPHAVLEDEVLVPAATAVLPSAPHAALQDEVFLPAATPVSPSAPTRNNHVAQAAVAGHIHNTMGAVFMGMASLGSRLLRKQNNEQDFVFLQTTTVDLLEMPLIYTGCCNRNYTYTHI
jgi:hypothetical protein